MSNSTKKIIHGISRRDILKLSAAGSAALILPWGSSSLSFAKKSPAIEHFVDPLPKPRVFSPIVQGQVIDEYNVFMQQIQHELHSDIGPVTTVWGYGDRDGVSSPGPTFEVSKGRTARVRWNNMLSADANEAHYLHQHYSVWDNIHGAVDNRKAVVHLHGGHIAAAVDGYPSDTILPTEFAEYDYKIDQQAATLWYHDHALGNTRLNVYMGLAGFFLVTDAVEQQLIANGSLPSSEYDYPIVIQDRKIKKNGQLAYHTLFDDSFFGDVAVVNGKAWPYLDVESGKYRFRLLNGSNSRVYNLQLGDGSIPFVQIGSDGGLLESPQEIYSLMLTPGERADVVIDFAYPGLNAGDDLVLINTQPSRPMEEEDEDPLLELMQFKIHSANVMQNVVLPATLSSIEKLSENDAVQERYFTLDDEYDAAIGDSKWLINGLEFDDIEEVVQNGAVEIWNWVNKSDMIHPMHIHLVQFQILGRYESVENSEGDLVPGADLGLDAGETGWKDTVRVGPKEIVRVIARFDGQSSGLDHELFPYHCHIIEHEDHEMMRQFKLQYV
ncbi:MAG: multicopper oxidase domain-containing protein [Gammaproteobacteria bacterium]|nr:multicopper oxidase domain-containing protein [Gammaproteobacteria bacterium]